MPDFYKIIDTINTAAAGLPFSFTETLILGSFALVFITAAAACAFSPKVREADKRPFFHYVNLYTALVFVTVAAHTSPSSAVLPAAAFWLAGYMLYGLLCMTGAKKRRPLPREGYSAAVPEPVAPKAAMRPDVPAAKTDVRLDHAIGITERLLTRELGRSDRQELEKIKTTLAFLHGKGNLTVQESDILNDNFNALLKFMAKYNE